MRPPVLSALAIVLLLSSCGGGGDAVAVGVVIDYQGDLVSVDSFTIRTTDGEDLTMVPSPGGDFSFPLPHLREHLATGDPVQVSYRLDGDALVATKISDA